MPLMIRRRPREGVRIGPDITVTVAVVEGGRAHLLIDAPREVRVLRDELEDLSSLARRPAPQAEEAAAGTPHPTSSRRAAPASRGGVIVQNKFTPGPWLRPSHPLRIEAQCGRTAWEGDSGVRTVAMCQDCCASTDFDSVEANARLIAAAPDLLAACRGLLAAVGYCADSLGYVYGPEVGEANRAIAKAEGGAP